MKTAIAQVAFVQAIKVGSTGSTHHAQDRTFEIYLDTETNFVVLTDRGGVNAVCYVPLTNVAFFWEKPKPVEPAEPKTDKPKVK